MGREGCSLDATGSLRSCINHFFRKFKPSNNYILILMKKFAKWISGIVLVLLIGYFIGPKPSKPEFFTQEINLPSSPADLEKQITDSEKSIKGIKPGNEARIIWADTVKKEKTKVSILYLHGFSGSQAEGDPVHTTLAKKYKSRS